MDDKVTDASLETDLATLEADLIGKIDGIDGIEEIEAIGP